MSSCERFPEHSRRRHICDGVGGLSLSKVNAYRQSWNIPPLDRLPDEQLSAPVIHAFAQQSHDVQKNVVTPCKSCNAKKTVHQGPGTELKKILHSKGVPSCQQCNDMAQRMNDMGPELCLNSINDLVEEMLPRAKKWIEANKPWTHALLPSIVEDCGIRVVLRGYIQQAVNAFNQESKEVPYA
jgi:hypothetical protein